MFAPFRGDCETHVIIPVSAEPMRLPASMRESKKLIIDLSGFFAFFLRCFAASSILLYSAIKLRLE